MTPSPLLARVFEVASRANAIVEDEHGRRSLADVLASAAALGRAVSRSHATLRGRRVLLRGEPSAAWICAFFAILIEGGIAVPIALGAPAPELSYFAKDAGADLAIVTDEGDAPFPDGVEVVRARAIEGRAEAPAELPSAGAPALVLYTSGTTGKPKGAILTHQNLATQASILREAWGFRDDDVLLHTLPMHHLHGIVVALLTALVTPAGVILLPRFDAGRVLAELGRATVFMAVPTIYQRLFEALDAATDEARADAARAARALRLATSGSAALPQKLAERWRVLSGALPLERYGMTEIGMALSNPLVPEGRRAGAVGRPLPSVEVRIVGDGGADGDGPGELFVRGPSVFAGYLGREEATRASFSDGWFMTGDVAQRDAEGVIRLLGRSSVDILKSGGEKVSALEIEETLREHPAVAEVAVVGLSDEVWGDRVVAAIVARPGSEAACSEEALRAFAKARLAAYKVPREVHLVPSLPRNAMGKVKKPEIAETLAKSTRSG